MNATRAYTIRYGVLLSIGRVQTPTLSMIVKRRREIDAFVPLSLIHILLLSARSLALLRRLPMPGIVLDVALRAGTVYAPVSYTHLDVYKRQHLRFRMQSLVIA